MTVFFVKPCKTYLYIEGKDINQVSPVVLALGSSNIFSAFIFHRSKKIWILKYDNHTHNTTLSWIQENLINAHILIRGQTDLMKIYRSSFLIFGKNWRHRINLGFEIASVTEENLLLFCLGTSILSITKISSNNSNISSTLIGSNPASFLLE